MFKQRADRIATRRFQQQWQGVGLGGNAKQGGTTAQHKAAGRGGGRAAAWNSDA